MKYIFDNHVHSKYSEDAKESIELIVKKAIKMGLKYITFTEHVDFNPYDNGYLYFNYENYSRDIYLARKKYSNKIEILKGIEFGEPHLYKKQFEIEKNRDYDLIIGSIHWQKDMFYGQKKLSEKYRFDKLMDLYYKETLKMIDYGGFDVLAHFEFPNRYFKKNINENELVNQILEKLIEKDIALEINTSGFRNGYNHFLPKVSTVLMYINKGGRKISLGSDAHKHNQLISEFNKIDFINEIDVGIFKNRKFIKIC